jgi:cytochrome oxidase Cu insertion factor (SCO1/SenC/PrrC family)
MEVILENLNHWRLGHVSDSEMLGIIASALNYEYTPSTEGVGSYGVSHNSRLYIIDQTGALRVLWRGTEWTYASIYHDIQILL